MATAPDRPPAPAYCSFKSFNSFFDDRRDDGHVTDVVDRSLMRNFAGSTAGELLGSLRYLGMIDEKGRPTDLYRKYVPASDEVRKQILKHALVGAYPYLLGAADFSIERATSQQVADKFRDQSISGSTLSRAITFFLAAAKQADVAVSPNIKPPASGPKPASRRQRVAPVAAPAAVNATPDPAKALGTGALPFASLGHVFDIPIPIGRKVSIAVPMDFSSDDWDFFRDMLGKYIEHWKKTSSNPALKEADLASAGSTSDKGP